MTRSLSYSKQAKPSTGRKGWDGAACCLTDWKKRPSHPTLFAKFLPKKNVYRMRCWMVQESLFTMDQTNGWIRILSRRWSGSGIRIANMSPIKKRNDELFLFQRSEFSFRGRALGFSLRLEILHECLRKNVEHFLLFVSTLIIFKFWSQETWVWIWI